MTRSDNGRASESFLVRFAREFGWRAYAIPVLAVITAFVLFDIFASGAEDAAPGTPGSTTASSGTAGDDTSDRGPGPDPADGSVQLPPTQLPPGGEFAQAGGGTYRVIGAPGTAAGEGAEETFRYVIEVEEGVDTAEYGGDDAVARFVDATLSDPRSWTNDPRFRFEHVGPDQQPNLRIQLSSVETTRDKCGGVDMEMETSCRTTIDGNNAVVLNDARWSRGAGPFQGDIGSYRQYLVNHEVGHAIGYAEHVACGENGALAPIMMQQTLSLNNSELNSFSPDSDYPDDNATCHYNAWPYPQPGAAPIQDGN